jgi:hypothetical protein
MKRTLFRRASDLGASPGLLYAALCNAANDAATNGAPVAIRTWERLGNDIGKSRRTAMRAAKKLQSCGLLLIMARRFNAEGQQVPNAFVLLSGERGRRRAPDRVRLPRPVAEKAFDLPPGYTVELEYDEDADRYVVTGSGLVELGDGEGDTDDTLPKQDHSGGEPPSSGAETSSNRNSSASPQGDTDVTPAKSGNSECQSPSSGGKPGISPRNDSEGEGDTDVTPYINKEKGDRERARAKDSSPSGDSVPAPAEEVVTDAVNGFSPPKEGAQAEDEPSLFEQLVNVFREAFRGERQFTFTRGWEETIERWIEDGRAPDNIPVFSKVLAEEVDNCRVKGCGLNTKYLLESYRREMEQSGGRQREAGAASGEQLLTFGEALDQLDDEGKPKAVHDFYEEVETEDGTRFRRKGEDIGGELPPG